MTDFDVIVLGVGGMGSSTCYYLAKRGISVLGIEQYSMAHANGSSHGRSRLIRKAYSEHPNYVPLLRRSYDLWDEISKEANTPLFHRTGVLYVGQESNSEVLTGVETSSKLHDIPIQHLSAEECQKRFPQFNIPDGYRAILEAEAGYIDIERSIETYCEHSIKLGAKLHFNEEVIEWTSDGSIVNVKTNHGEYRASKMVITAGPWSSKMLQLGKTNSLELNVQKVPLFWFDTTNPTILEVSGGMPCFGFDMPYGFIYGFPYNSDEGIKIAAHIPGAIIDDPSNFDRSVQASELEPVQKCVRSCLPLVNGNSPRSSTTCMYTMSSDSHFIIDHHPTYSNISFAAGLSGHGYKFSPVIGEILTDLATEGKTLHPINFLRRR